MGNPRKTFPLYLPQVVTLRVFFICLTLCPRSPLVVYRKVCPGLPSSRSAKADTGQFPKKDDGDKGRGFSQCHKKPSGIQSVKACSGCHQATKKPGVILRKGLLGVDGLPKKAACLSWFQIRESKGTGSEGYPKTKKQGACRCIY